MKNNIKIVLGLVLIGIIVIVIGVFWGSEKDISNQAETFYQYIDENGNIVSKDCYLSAGDFNNNGVALVKKRYSSKGEEYNRYFYINTAFEVVSKGSWDSREHKHYSYENNDSDFITYATSIPSDSLKIMDSSFNDIAEIKDVKIEDEYKDIHDVQEGMILVCSNNGLFGYVNTEGEWVIAPQFEDANSFTNGIASVFKDGYWGAIDAEGNFVIDPKYYRDINFKGDGEIAAAKTGDDTVIYIDRTGQKVINKEYSYSQCQNYFSDGLAFVLDSKTNLYGYIDRSGEYVITPQFEHAYPFYNGVAVVSQMVDGKELFGYINKNGEKVLDCKYDMLDNFSDETPILAEQNGKWGYIDAKGNWVISPNYDWASQFSNGYAVVEVPLNVPKR